MKQISKKWKILFLVALLPYLALSLEYGESCRFSDDLCNPYKYLECSPINSTCQCKEPSNTIYDQVFGQCTRLVGASCEYEGQICAANSYCPIDVNPVCTCSSGFEENSYRQCFHRHSSSCDPRNDQCDPYAYLECNPSNNTCQCKEPANAIYDPVPKQCRRLVEATCEVAGQPCVSNSYCPDAINSRCTCPPGFEENNDRQCFLPHSSDCNTENDQCDPYAFLQCSTFNSTCQCKDYENAIYDPVLRQCGRLVDAPCVFRGQSCAANSYCPSNDIDPRCICYPGFNENNHRQCFNLHSMSCSPLDDQCDPYAYLQCARQPSGSYECRCQYGENLSWYNILTRTCHLTAGGETCSVIPGDMPCVPNSICDDSSRKCKCDPGVTQTPQGLCYKSYNSPCDPSSPSETCDVSSYLSCDPLTSTCLCGPRGEAIYEDAVHQCVLLAEANCNPNPGAQMCIRDSSCMPSRFAAFSPYVCRCNYNLFPNKNRKCFLEYGSQCDRLQDYCDKDGFMWCGFNNTCSCMNPYATYNSVAKECKLDLGAPCSSGDGQTCGDNAYCDQTEGICRCQPGFEDDGNGNCSLSLFFKQ